MPKSNKIYASTYLLLVDTLKDCKKANIKGIVVKAGQNIFLDKFQGLNLLIK